MAPPTLVSSRPVTASASPAAGQNNGTSPITAIAEDQPVSDNHSESHQANGSHGPLRYGQRTHFQRPRPSANPPWATPS